jgi:hypothetical protein
MDTGKLVTIVEKRAAKLIWGALVLAWSLFRAIAIRYFFNEYGINFWAYLTVDLGTSIPYAKYSADLVVTILKKDRIGARRATALTALFFYLPDLYVILFSNKVPASLWSGFAISMAGFSALAIWQILQSIRKGEDK